MNIRIKNLLLIGSIVASVILSGCNKDDDNTKPSGGTPPPTNNEKPVSTQVCPYCLFEKHDTDAIYCKKCGTKLNTD